MSGKESKVLFSSMMGPGTFTPATLDGVALRDSLPTDTYSVQVSPTGAYYLKQEQHMVLPTKIYGKTNGYAARILRTYHKNTEKNTGVILVGDKGSGKTLLAKQLSALLRAERSSTYIINSELAGASFNSFIASLPRGILIFDELEKVYDKEHQEALLTLFDGTSSTNHLMVVAANDKWSVDKNFKNRPGRLHYWIEFGAIDEQAIREYCEDYLDNKSEIPNILALASYQGAFSFDMLVALVKEMNIQEMACKDAVDILNIREDPWNKVRYTHTITLDKLDVTQYFSVELYNETGAHCNKETVHPGVISKADVGIRVYNTPLYDRKTGKLRTKLSGLEKKIAELICNDVEFDESYVLTREHMKYDAAESKANFTMTIRNMKGQEFSLQLTMQKDENHYRSHSAAWSNTFMC